MNNARREADMGDEPTKWEPVHLPEPVVEVRRWSWRLALAAVGMGAVGAFAAAIVRLSFRGLQWILTGSSADPPVAASHLAAVRRACTPAVGALLATAVLLLQRWRDRKQGREPRPYVEYVAAIRHEGGRIPLAPNSWRTAAAAFSVASGAAVGREGSMIQFAAAVASVCGRWHGWLEDEVPPCLPLLVACGVAGGVETAYNAPLAAVFFAAEITLGGLQWAELVLLVLAAGAGWMVSGPLLGHTPLYPTQVTVRWGWQMAWLAAIAVVLGIAGPVYQWLLGSLRQLRRLPGALVWSGVVVGCLSLVETRVWGNGDVALDAVLGHGVLHGAPAGSGAIGRVLMLRLVATLSCVWTGTVGGVFTPTLFAGGAVGALLGHAVAGSSTAMWAMAGMSFLIASVTHAPLMAGFMVAELTGDWKLVPFLLPLNFLSWWIARRISPMAMYAIASQSPAQAEPDGPERPER